MYPRDHIRASSVAEVARTLIEDNLRAGSAVVTDNTNISTFSMRKYIDYARNSGKYESHGMQVQWGEMEVNIKL